MTAEFVLLLFLTVVTAWGVALSGPRKVFSAAGPKLGARIEKQLTIGENFVTNGSKTKWY